MKKFTLLLTAILTSILMMAQTPAGINYQTVVRNGDGDALPYTDIWLKVSILADAPDGTAVYSEIHPAATNGFGLVNLVIGHGTILSGNFGEINWSNGLFYLETAINFDGGAGFQMMGVTQLLSVPFAKYANFSAGLKSMTTEERDALQSPPAGMTIYNTTTNCLNYWSGGNWFETCGACTPQPSNAIAGSAQIFYNADTSVVLQANVPASGAGAWSKVSGAGGYFEDVTDPHTTFHGLPCTVYYLRWSISTSCATKTSTVKITFDAQPTPANAGDDLVFNDETNTVTLAGNNPVIGEGWWTVVIGQGGTFENPAIPTTQFTGLPCQTYTLRWTIASDCHESYDEMSIVFDPIPTLAEAGEDVLINTELTTITLAANAPEVGSGLWTVTGGEGGTFASATDPNTNFTGLPCQTYTLTWTISTACYESNDEMVVVFDAIPTEAVAGEDFTINTEETSILLTANTPEVGAGHWSVVEGEEGVFTDAANPETLFTGLPCQTYLLRWTISTDCHESFDEITVVFDAVPTAANAGENIFITTDQASVNLSANTPEVGTGEWTILAGEGGILTEPSDPGTLFTGQPCTAYELAWIISTECHVSTATLTVSFFNTPTEADAGPDQLGLTGTWTTLAANVPQNGTGQWTILSGEGGTLTNPASPTTILLGQNLQHYMLKWEVSTNCATSSDTVNVAFGFVPFLNCGDSLFDSRDGQYYATIQIGEQCWMAENLAWLPSVNPPDQGSLTDPLYYVYDYNGNEVTVAKSTNNYLTFGVLYNWASLSNVCPEGWHLPIDAEWTLLTNYLSSQNELLCNNNTYFTAKALATITNWDTSTNTCAVGNDPTSNNATGYSGSPAGYRRTTGDFRYLGQIGIWWSSSEESGSNTWNRNLNFDNAEVFRNASDKAFGFSVRCLKDFETVQNLPPSPPSNPSPETGSLNQTITPTLTWDCTDPDGDPITYDVYFGTDTNPPLVVSGITISTYTPATLENSTTYYWKIVAHDDQGNSTEGEVWSFGTESGDGKPCPGTPTVTDIDGNVYNTVKIGNQCWMKENLKTTKYRNNTPIEYPGTNAAAWENNTTGAYAWYNNNIANKTTYGALYNWYAVNNSAGLCPTGWHVPTDAQWTALTTFVSSQPDYQCASNTSYIAKALAAKTNWNSATCTCCVGNNPNANNATNFTGLPGGYRGTSGAFNFIGSIGPFWSSTESSAIDAWCRTLDYSFSDLGRGYNSKGLGFSVRCLRD